MRPADNSTSITNELGVVERGTVRRDDKQSDYQTVSKAIEIMVDAIIAPADITTDQNTIGKGIDREDLLMGIVYKVISDGYLIGNTQSFNPEIAMFFEQKFEKSIKEAKRMGKEHYVTGPRTIKPTEF